MQNGEALQAYFGRVTAAIPELFNMAHAICGNCDQAAYALQYTLVEAWLGDGHGVGFREGMRYTLRGVALDAVRDARAEPQPAEFTWKGFSASGDSVLALIAQEPLETQRMLALRYGCGLSAKRIAWLTGVPAGRVREALRRFERRAARQSPARAKGRAEVRIVRAVRRAFAHPDAAMPSMGAIYRAFEAEAAEVRKPKHLAARVARRIAYVLLVALCAVIFWFAAALLQPAVQEAPETPAAADAGAR